MRLQTVGEAILQNALTLEMSLSFDPAIPLFKTHTREALARVHKMAGIKSIIRALFVVEKTTGMIPLLPPLRETKGGNKGEGKRGEGKGGRRKGGTGFFFFNMSLT